MNKKSILTGVIGIIVFSIVFGYSLVFAGTGLFDNSLSISFKSSENIYLDSITLNKTKILFKSGHDLSEYKIKSECNIFSKLTSAKGGYYMFDLKFFDNKCEKENFVLVDSNDEVKLNFKLNLLSEYDIYTKLLDLDSDKLARLKQILNKKIQSYKQFQKYDSTIEKNYYIFLEKNRILSETIYNRDLIDKILEKRSEKYIVPVAGRKMPTNQSKIPNTGRPYRQEYTDGIHHGWDIDADFGEQVIALDDGIIVRTVTNFEFSDLDKIKKGKALSNEDLTRNLDILRGNQVWLKTMSGDVVFYSHLNEIFSNIKIGEVVKKGQPLGTVGKTGVPDENYTDYHLHFEVQKNPFNLQKNQEYDLDDYMKWDWLLKGKNTEFILENQFKYFNK
ncbi:MAG: M23 family metallopeptidase [Candidatus Gracilibacteria bacterium]|nr:M23 family metallopeptidase [Candidatus Gracilibacteria bacterium]